ncbi:MAG: hypothetical protein WCO09_04240, partial [bacterium]
MNIPSLDIDMVASRLDEFSKSDEYQERDAEEFLFAGDVVDAAQTLVKVVSPDVKIPCFSGKKDTIRLSEWLPKFDLTAESNKWSDAEKIIKLKSLCEGSASDFIRDIVTPADDPVKGFAILRATLNQKFGLSPERAFNAMIERKFHPEKETADRFLCDLRSYAKLCIPNFREKQLEILLSFLFWRQMPADVVGIKSVKKRWKDAKESLDWVLNEIRDCFDCDDSNELAAFFESQDENKP